MVVRLDRNRPHMRFSMLPPRWRGWAEDALGGIGTGMGWQIIAAAVAGYLALLGRSAWKQGEFRQFLRSLAIVAILCALLAGTVAVAMMLDRT